MPRCSLESDTLFCWKRHVVLLKTTRCFIENDTLFCWKRHVVLLKTIRCFIENDTLFCWKRYVVFGKTIPYRGRIELSFFALCDTCDSKKVKSLLDASAYVREKHPLPWGDASQNTKIWGTFFVGKIHIWERTMWSACEGYLFEITLFCFLWFAKLAVVSRESAFYREFFTLCTYISPYTNRGARNEEHLIHRKKTSAIGGEESGKPIATDDVWYK